MAQASRKYEGALPAEFQEVITGLKERGCSTEWVTMVVDPDNRFATFVKDGKPWYRSDCQSYEGYWLHGGLGSVQCKAVGQLIPGLFWDLFCKENCEQCFYHQKEIE